MASSEAAGSVSPFEPVSASTFEESQRHTPSPVGPEKTSISKGPRESVSTSGGNEPGRVAAAGWPKRPSVNPYWCWQPDAEAASCEAGGVVVVAVQAAKALGEPEPARTAASVAAPATSAPRPINAGA